MEKARKAHTVELAVDFADYLDVVVRIRGSHFVDSELPKRHKPSYRSCVKIRYRDRREAIEALHSAQLARVRQERDWGNSNRKESYSYSCDLCKGWHLTSQTRIHINQAKVISLNKSYVLVKEGLAHVA